MQTLIEKLDSCPRITADGRHVPFYHLLKTWSIAAAQRPLLEALSRACGGVAVISDIPNGVPVALEMRQRFNASIAVSWNVRYDGDPWPAYDKLSELKVRGLRDPSLIVVYHEGHPATLDQACAYRAHAKQIFPTAKIAYYHDGPSLSYLGPGRNTGIWRDGWPPSDATCCNLYASSADGCASVLHLNALLEKPILPTIGPAVYDVRGLLPNKAPDNTSIFSYRTPEQWYAIGWRLGQVSRTAPGLAGMYGWMSALDHRVNAEEWVDRLWIPLARGWNKAGL